MRRQKEHAEVHEIRIEVELLANDPPVAKVGWRRRLGEKRLDGGQRSRSERSRDEKVSAAQCHGYPPPVRLGCEGCWDVRARSRSNFLTSQRPNRAGVGG